jgi:hypothetical protein
MRITATLSSALFATLCALALTGTPKILDGRNHSARAHGQSLSVAGGDMIGPEQDASQCLSVDGPLSTARPLVLRACRGTDDQRWERGTDPGVWRSMLDTAYCLASTDAPTSIGTPLTARLCTDSRALVLSANPALSDSFRLAGAPTRVIDWGVYGYPAIASQNGWSYQKWRWLQPALDVVNASGCAIAYPVLASDAATYQRELACDRVAKLQPPYLRPAGAMRDATLFPGALPAGSATVTRTLQVNLTWQEHGYLRMSTPPEPWHSTGLWAPPDAVLRVNVAGLDAADGAQLWVRIGEHTDVLEPDSANVREGTFDRYPSVSLRARLAPGETLVRNPYGGAIVIESARVAGKELTATAVVTIAGAVPMPFLRLGETSEAQWNAARGAPAPYATLEGAHASIHVPAAQIATLSYTDAINTMRFYDRVILLHNTLSGLSAGEVITHRSPLGRQRLAADAQITAGSGHSGFPIMVFNNWRLAQPSLTAYSETNWGIWHEIGHNYQMDAWSYVFGVETTVNLWSLHAESAMFGSSRLVTENAYPAAIARVRNPAINDAFDGAGPFEQLVFFEQLRLAFPEHNWTVWPRVMRRYREMPHDALDALDTDQAKRDTFAQILCDVTGVNVLAHFDAWDIAISQSARTACQTRTPLTKQPWLIDAAALPPAPTATALATSTAGTPGPAPRRVYVPVLRRA